MWQLCPGAAAVLTESIFLFFLVLFPPSFPKANGFLFSWWMAVTPRPHEAMALYV
jgi:hypothetical protein